MFAMSGDQQPGVPLQQYVERKYGEDWIENPEAVRFVEGVMMIDVALVAGLEVPTSIPISMLPGNWMGDHCCWICGDADHWSYQCPDNCCWTCGDRPFKPYDSLVEAMIDLKFKDLAGWAKEWGDSAGLAAPEELPPRCGCMNGEAQCLERSSPGTTPPRCRHCAVPIGGVCQCDCFSCWDSEPAAGELPNSLPAEVSRMELEDGVEQPKPTERSGEASPVESDPMSDSDGPPPLVDSYSESDDPDTIAAHNEDCVEVD